MFEQLRLKKRQLDGESALAILQNGEYGVLSVCGGDGYGYGVPLNYIYSGGAIYFHCATEGKKLREIANNNRVSFCVISKAVVMPEKFTTSFESAILFGRAAEVLGDEKIHAFKMLVEKYSPAFLEKGLQYIEAGQSRAKVFKIEIEHLCGKSND
jgi:nitroimidazol reductase NimA-like FMN-containing flavoprotein (pyridoxamine 5'-phosphate oxidase superfamily)